MDSKLRTVNTIIGAVFGLQGIGWLLAPHMVAESLGMPALEGLGRSTQFGDFAAFFLMLGATILLGSRPGYSRVLFFPAGLLATAAVCRTFAWAVHNASFAGLFITVEVVTSVLLLTAAMKEDDDL